MRALVLGALALLLAACGDAPTDDGDVTSPEPSAVTDKQEYQEPVPDHDSPPDVVISAGDDVVAEVSPYTSCWTLTAGSTGTTGCADGVPPDPLPDIGTHTELVVEFPEDGWEFTAGFSRVDDPCARTPVFHLERLSPTTFALPPAGAPGTYDVGLSGKGDSSSVAARFRWTTTAEGELPPPQALLDMLYGDAENVDSFGASLSITDLAETPEQASATITVTAAGGESLTFEPTLSRHAPEGCSSHDGALFWDGTTEQGLEAARLGDAPFTYTVDLVLDGRTYQGTGDWPDDVVEGKGAAVALTFDPPLPAAR